MSGSGLALLWPESLATSPPAFFAKGVFAGEIKQVSVSPNAAWLAWTKPGVNASESVYDGSSPAAVRSSTLNGMRIEGLAVSDYGQVILARVSERRRKSTIDKGCTRR